MDIKITKLLLTIQKQTIGCMQSKKIVFFVENKRKKKALVLKQLIFITHTKKKENFTIEIFKADFFRLPPFSLLRDFSFQNTFEHFAIRFRQSYLIWEVSDVTAVELSS